ncbi:MAG: cobalt-precorrin-5B (C(1))-methyltransferase CbiD [Lachnospiraceae bacterium]|nr:cobalt-precorrin-5B (C(1))-methyltransferase CbiD [Lachnospiraceae bacterium]
MALNEYIQSGGKYLRCGYTTGTCAALASLAAAKLLLLGEAPRSVSVITPKGIKVEVKPEICEPAEAGCGCASAIAGVRKDAGDDRDATDGILVCARVTVCEIENAPGDRPVIMIDGGEGVGRVTKPGLDQPVGCAAINRVPRRMIEEAVGNVCELADYRGEVSIVISVPGGEEIAKKTFNGHLGIKGGVSILGTSGIVEPMSMQAFIDTVCLEIRQARSLDDSGRLILVPGNYGADFLRKMRSGAVFGQMLPPDIPVVMCSNFIGDALDAARAEGFREVLLVGHIGKMVKLSGGIMNTHSGLADCRMELFAAHAAICGAGGDICKKLMQCATTDACLELLKEEGFVEIVMGAIMASIERYLVRRTGGEYETGAVVFSNVYGLLGVTAGGENLLGRWR